MKSNECIGPHPVPRAEMGLPYDNPDVAIGFSHLLLPENNDCSRIVVFSLHAGFATYRDNCREDTSPDDALRLLQESECYFFKSGSFEAIPQLRNTVETARVHLANMILPGTLESWVATEI